MALDRHTRGRTAPGRLRALDAFLAEFERPLLERVDGPWSRAPFVDVGFGDSPITTLEAAECLRAVNPMLPVIGVEREAQRVMEARRFENASTHFREGGFTLPLEAGETPRLIRLLNVLRQYPEADVEGVHAQLGASLLEDGLLVEGSAERDGSIVCVHLLRKRGQALFREALLLHTDFSRGFAPLLFRDWLPRDFRRRVRPGEPIFALFREWTQVWEQTRGEDPAQSFTRSLQALAERVEGVQASAELLARGYFLWRPVAGVPR